MNKTLIVLILAVIVLSWNFIFTSEKKIDLTDEAKVLQGLSLAIKYKIAIRKYWQEKGQFPTAELWQQEPAVVIDTSKSLVKDIEVGVDDPGAITVTFTNKETIRVEEDINDKKIVLTPYLIDGKLDWSCKGTLKKELMPKPCQ